MDDSGQLKHSRIQVSDAGFIMKDKIYPTLGDFAAHHSKTLVSPLLL